MKLRIRLLAIFGFLLSLNHAAAQVSFASATNYSVGNRQPPYVTAADINGDGKVDLISSDYNTNMLTILTNNGSGVFGSNATYSAGSGYGVPFISADVNGDGHVDFFTIGQTGNVVVLTNNGNGVLGSNASYTVGKYPFSVAVADVNGNGKVDLISANDQDNTLTVFTNNGGGIFGSNATYTVGKEPFTVVAADINRDGKVDLISANFSENTLTVLTNNGGGVFGFNATLNVGQSPKALVATDVNGDGMPDLISGSESSVNPGGLTIWINNGNGIFSSNATFAVNYGQVIQITAADVNGDGKVDLICAINPIALVPGQLLILTNNGSGTFGSNTTISVEYGTFGVVAADVNGDGKADLITPNTFGASLSVLMNTETFPPPSSMPTLHINTFGNGLLASWPSASAGWSLQQNPELTTSNWSPSGYSGYDIADDGTNKSLIVTPTTESLFLRLSHP